ncbi:MAG TPA: homoserine kinase [Longimicrobiales bacterium]
MVEVRVPCSTSNLGAGFDCIGLAFRRYLTVRYTAGTAALRVARSGTVLHLRESPEHDAVVLAVHASLGPHLLTGSLEIHSDIPVGRGLGSSAAARVAGLAIAAAIRDEARDRLHDAAMLTLAMQLEGHPDNAAPSLLGGLVVVARDADGAPRAFQSPVSRDIAFGFAAPETELSTTEARAALPQNVPHARAARMLGRMGALVRGLETADPELLRLGLLDELHMPYRLPLIPGGATAIEAAIDCGAWGATVSGSGSGIIAVGPHDRMPAITGAMRAVFDRFATTAISFMLEPDTAGLQTRTDPGSPWR